MTLNEFSYRENYILTRLEWRKNYRNICYKNVIFCREVIRKEYFFFIET